MAAGEMAYGYSYGLYISPAAAAVSAADTRGGGGPLTIPADDVGICCILGAKIIGAPAGVGDRSAAGKPAAAVNCDGAVMNLGASVRDKPSAGNKYKSKIN